MYIYVYTHINVYIYMNIYLHVYMYIYIYMRDIYNNIGNFLYHNNMAIYKYYNVPPHPFPSVRILARFRSIENLSFSLQQYSYLKLEIVRERPSFFFQHGKSVRVYIRMRERESEREQGLYTFRAYTNVCVCLRWNWTRRKNINFLE